MSKCKSCSGLKNLGAAHLCAEHEVERLSAENSHLKLLLSEAHPLIELLFVSAIVHGKHESASDAKLWLSKYAAQTPPAETLPTPKD
jgi:hypothetical protein